MASRPTLYSSVGGIGGVNRAPGKGDFSVEADRQRVGKVLSKLVWSKLISYLVKKDFHNYRFLLNLQKQCFEGLELLPIESMVPHFRTEIDPVVDPEGFLVARFLHECGFHSISERDSAGWSPMCYAVLRDDPLLVKALLASRAEVNDSISKAKKEAKLPRKLPILLMACAYHCNRAMASLLTARANVNVRGDFGVNALASAAVYNNKDAVRLLVEAKIDSSMRVFPGTSPFNVAVSHGSVETMQEMMRYFPAPCTQLTFGPFGLRKSSFARPDCGTPCISAWPSLPTAPASPISSRLERM